MVLVLGTGAGGTAGLAGSRVGASGSDAGGAGGGGAGVAGAGDAGAGSVGAIGSGSGEVRGWGSVIGGVVGVSISVSTGFTGASVTVGVVLVFNSSAIKILNKEFLKNFSSDLQERRKLHGIPPFLKELKIKFSFLIFLFQKQKIIIKKFISHN